MQKKTRDSAVLRQIPLTAKQKSFSTNNGDVDKEDLLKALLALKNGNFSFRLAGSKTGIAGKIYNTINEIADLNSKTITSFKIAEDSIGKNGKLNERLEVPKERGQWTIGIKSINSLISDLVHPTIEIANVISDVAKGNLSVKMPLIIEGKPLKGEFNKIAKEVNDMVKQLNLFSMEVTRVAREVGSEGKLGEQAKLKGVGGVWKVIKMIGTSQDITELKKTEEQLKIFNLFERMLNEIYIFSERNFKVLYANVEALRNLGHTANLINNYTLFEILTDFKKTSFKKTIAPLLNGTKDKIITFGSFKRKDGSIYPIELHLQLIEQNEKKVFLATVLDLTERKRTEQVLAASLKEKEILLKEVHHRVKNNLQIIYSLINLQSNSISDKNVLDIFKVSQNRIKSMALIHEKLYRQNNLSMVNFTEYLRDLASSLAYSYSIETSHIEFKLNTQQVFLNIDLAVSLGLCATELITNCFKYAFPDRRRGEICLDLNFYNNNKMILSIKDNGIGLPDSFDFKEKDSLGLKLVSSLVEQHHGLLKIDTNGATGFILEIPFKDNIISPSLNFNREMEEKFFPSEKLPI